MNGSNKQTRAAEFVWNPWHGCKKYSDGCRNCYVYRRDERVGRDASLVTKNKAFALPLAVDRQGSYKIPAGSTVYVCMTGDFFMDHPLVSVWRNEVWAIIRQRADVSFTIITKRIVRFYDCLPDDWGDGYDNVSICCTMENQKACDERLPFFLTLPIKHKYIICEPLLSDIDFRGRLSGIVKVVVGGESGEQARVCRYDYTSVRSALRRTPRFILSKPVPFSKRTANDIACRVGCSTCRHARRTSISPPVSERQNAPIPSVKSTAKRHRQAAQTFEGRI